MLFRSLQGDVKFQNVWFAYQNEEWVLRDVSFHLPPGKTMAIVGATGSGKTTIASLVNQLYQQQTGDILLDDINIQSLNITSVRQQIAFVLQDVFLFSGSVKDNIQLHNQEIDIQKMISAARSIGAYEFIEKLPGGFDYKIGRAHV